MGATKYPITDPDFRLKIAGACLDAEQRGLISLLDVTGMHIKCAHELTEKNLIKQGSRTYVQWQRAKTSKTMRFPLPKDSLPDILTFINRKRRKTLRWYHQLIGQIGTRAGFEGVSSMTFRHNRAIRAIREEKLDLFQVPHLLGCSLNVAARNYTVLRMDELHEKDEEKENTASE